MLNRLIKNSDLSKVEIYSQKKKKLSSLKESFFWIKKISKQ